jgi:CRISP-associated protein Cas1
MDLYINTYGTYLHKRDDMFELEVDGKKTKIAPSKVRSICISTGAFITTDSVKLALDNNIDIVLMDEYGNPYGRFWHSRFGSTAFIRRRQIEVADTVDGLALVKEWIKNKIGHSIKHLKELEYKRNSKAGEIEERIAQIEQYVPKIDNIEGVIDEQRNTLQGYEGNASKLYFDILSYLIPEPYKFEGRSSRPAKDEFNCMINYGFGVLYGKVEKAIIIAGLDPFVGIMHTDNYNKKSFVFDMIENYRHYAVKTVFSMFSRKRVNKSFFDEIRGGYSLNKEGKKELLTELSEFFDKETLYDGRKIKNLDIIQYDCHKVANKLIGKT